MKVTVAKSAGFCFGVKRAVDMVEKLCDQGEKICTLGPIIHNEQVVEKLKSKGVASVDNIDSIPKDCAVVIRSHGVSSSVYSELLEKNIRFFDATCPFVEKIHKIVKEESKNNVVIICGDKNHPEVQGIVGHCSGEYYVVSNSEEMKNLGLDAQKPLSIVAQTTFNTIEWKKTLEILEKDYTNYKIFDTICSATSIRQNEAVDLSKKCDIMIVIGGKNSSNTAKLEKICSQNSKTVWVQSAKDLNPKDFDGCNLIGVTAGASTPVDIIKEVQDTMSELEKNMEGTTFEEMLEQSFKSIYNGEKVTATVVSVTATEVLVDVGTKHTGYVLRDEMTDDPSADIRDLAKVGDELDLIVLRVNDVEGTVMLSKKRLEAQAGFEKVMAAAETDEIFDGVIVDAVRGGVIALTNGVRVFIPASLATLGKVEDLKTLLKTKVRFKILEANRQKRRALGSVKAVLLAEKKAVESAFWADAEVGKKYTGTVKSLTSYGAFVDLGGVDGMVHISELSWERIKKPSDVVKVGDQIEVYVKDISEDKKISLGFKKAEDNPWEILKNNYEVGSTCTVKIISMTTFGAFAQVIPGIDGLIHISQISNKHIAKPQDVLEIGQEVEAQITELDFDKKRVNLSIRALMPEEAPAEVATEEVAEEAAAE